MSDLFIFIFGLFVTALVLVPLAVAAAKDRDAGR
jgi:hypothetical protein